jgi:Amt family ammonium transporter
MSRGKQLFALALFVFIALVAVGQFGHGGSGDPGGTKTAAYSTPTKGSVNDDLATTSKDVPVTQVGVNKLANETGHLRVSINFTWLLITGFLVLFMQVGFGFLVTGLTRAKNAGHMMMMNIAAFAVALLVYYAVGFAFQFGGVSPIANLGNAAPLNGIFGHGTSGVIGLHGFFLQSSNTYDVGVLAFFLFQVVFMETAAYIIIGAIAERVSFAGFLVAEIALAALIYPVYGMWMWGGGWLSQLGNSIGWGHGAVDFAGSGVVHATGGWIGLALAMILGPRIGKYRRDGTIRAFPGHNLGYAVIGTLVLLFGWMGFNPGSTFGSTDLRISVVAVNTLLSACAGAVTAMAWTNAKYGKPDISMTCNGMLAGLVAITAPCAFVAPWAAVFIGVIAGFLVCYSVRFLEGRARIDDPCGAISVHGTCGVWGLLAVGLFADGTYPVAGWNGVAGPVKGLFYGDVGQLGAQMVDIVVGFLWAWGMAWIIFSLAKRFVKVRVSPEVELEGTDLGEFGQVCYPDFVQVTETDARLRDDDLAVPYLTVEEQAQASPVPVGEAVGAVPPDTG